MTTKGRTFRSQWVKRDEPKAPPEDSAHKKALRLPKPGPGIPVDVPLHLLPEYLAIYRLEPMSRGEVAESERTSGRRKPSGCLYVKRTPKRKESQ
jgi:hypothetical protein